MKSQFAHTPRGPIEYTLQGSGPLVLICHGASSDCFSSGLARPLVEAGFSVLIPSRPGYGRTPLEIGWSSELAAKAFIALLDELNVGKVAVVAISSGGPTGIALAAGYPQRVERLVLAAAISHTENRKHEITYRDQVAFYGPLHSVTWKMLGLASQWSPRRVARQTLAIFSTHDALDGLSRLSPTDIEAIRHFYQGRSSRAGALNDLHHTVRTDLLKAVGQPVLVIHSREDKSVPFSHAQWSLQHIPRAQLCEVGFTGHFFWIGPDSAAVGQRMIDFLSRKSH